MKPLTREWVEKAEEDFIAAVRLAQSRKTAVWNVVCFHCQQCVEKYLKACLQEVGADMIPKSHNLLALLDLLLPLEPSWKSMHPSLSLLNGFAVEFRYPGESATREDAQATLSACKEIRHSIRKRLLKKRT
jgi:HEPN domain-containing protein